VDVIAGLIPWIGFLWPAVRDAVRGGWAKKNENADAWFSSRGRVHLSVFSKSHSKLAPYILPIFPALAVAYRRVAGENRAGRGRREAAARGAGQCFSFFCGLLALALCVVVSRPALMRMPAEQPIALADPGVCHGGGAGGRRDFRAVARGTRGVRTAVRRWWRRWRCFCGADLCLTEHPEPATKDARGNRVARRSRANACCITMSFFTTFTFSRSGWSMSWRSKGELELEEDAAARASGRFMEEVVSQLWEGAGGCGR